MIDRNSVYDRLHPIFREYFENDSLMLTDTTTAAHISGWDSLAHISLIVSIEKEFDIHLGVKNSARLKNVGALVDAIAGKLST